MRTIIGVMGGAEASAATERTAQEVGRLVAEQDWVLLNGGRHAGVMAASAAGARAAGGLVVGVLPDEHTHGMSLDVDIPILTGMGDARNIINVLSSRVVIALPGGAGTISEVAHALKLGRPVVVLGLEIGALFTEYRQRGTLVSVSSPTEAIEAVRVFLKGIEAE